MKSLRRLGLAAGAVLMLSTPLQAADIVIGIRSEPSSIDPYFHNLGPNNAMLGQIFDRLNDWTPKMDKMFGRAAKSWKAINETTWEYKLLKGSSFTMVQTSPLMTSSFPTIEQLIIRAVIRALEPTPKVKLLKKIDDYTIHITTEKPYPLMPNDTTTVMIMSSEAKGTGGKNKGISAKDFNNGLAAIGSGPYKFVEWKKVIVLSLKSLQATKGRLNNLGTKSPSSLLKLNPLG